MPESHPEAVHGWGRQCALRKRGKEMRGVFKVDKALAGAFRSGNRLEAAFLDKIKAVEKEIKELIFSPEELSRTYRILMSRL